MSTTPRRYPSDPNLRNTTLRGRLINSTWHCDCSPRVPAAYFQTKKEGPNQGRWFYTCANKNLRGKENNNTRGSGSRGCVFFLWEDEAAMREGLESTTVTGYANDADNGDGDNNRRGSDIPRTPSKTRHTSTWREGGMLTPDTTTKNAKNKRSRGFDDEEGSVFESPTKGRRVGNESRLFETKRDEYSFSWNEDLDLDGETDSGIVKQESPERKNPSKYSPPQSLTTPTKPLKHSSSTTPRRPTSPSSYHGPYPITPTPTRFSTTPLTSLRDMPAKSHSSSSSRTQCPLVSQTLALLDSYRISLPPEAKDDLVQFLNTQDLRTKGIMRGRDISRLATQKKEEKIQELQGRIDTLEAERETWRAATRDDDGIKLEDE